MNEQQKKCIDCKECCEYVEFPLNSFSAPAIELFIIRGHQVMVDRGGRILVRVYAPCIHLTETGCKIYKKRPKACRLYFCDAKDKRHKKEKNKLFEKTTKEMLKIVQDAMKEKE